jgi:hypothetical protein
MAITKYQFLAIINAICAHSSAAHAQPRAIDHQDTPCLSPLPSKATNKASQASLAKHVGAI